MAILIVFRNWPGLRRFSLMALLACGVLLASVQSGLCTEVSPQRIVSLGPMHTKNIYLLGAEDRLVANTVYCLTPEAARRKKKIGTVLQIDIEHIFSLRPDLILATGLTQPQQINGLRRLGLRVVQLKEPRSFQEISSQFLTLGCLLGLEKKAQSILGGVTGQLQVVRSSIEGLAPQKVLLQIGANPLFAATAASFTHDYISLAGDVNIAAAESGRYNPEKVVEQNPDVIIIAIMGGQTGLGLAEKKKWQEISSIGAARNDRIFLIDPDLVCSPTPVSFVEALTVISRLVHPELADRSLLSTRE